MTNIEVEFRAIIPKEKYDWLNNYLITNAKDLGRITKILASTPFFRQLVHSFCSRKAGEIALAAS